jgi:hypothetical protein
VSPEAVNVERLGGRQVVTVRTAAGGFVRIYRRGSRWYDYQYDQPVRDRKLVEAARRMLRRQREGASR